MDPSTLSSEIPHVPIAAYQYDQAPATSGLSSTSSAAATRVVLFGGTTVTALVAVLLVLMGVRMYLNTSIQMAKSDEIRVT